METTIAPVSRDDLLIARQRIAPYVNQTPLNRSFLLSELVGRDVWLKLENLQRTGSFKARGALNKVMSLTSEERERGVVAASAGNHALGVAYACRALGVGHVVLFVQQIASVSKLNRLREYAVDVRLAGDTFEDAQLSALEYVRETGAVYVPAYDDPAIVAGQGTCGLEILEQVGELDAIVVPVGGGGLIAGVALALKSTRPDVRVIGVNPTASPSALLSLERGHAIDPYPHQQTVADPLAGGFGATPFRVAHALIDEIVLVSEAEIKRGVATLIDTDQVLAEAAGAAGVAAIVSGKTRLEGRTVVLVSGGNIDSTTLKTLLDDIA